MTTSTSQTRLSRFALVNASRAFRISLTPGKGETYGLVLEETYGDALAAQITKATAAQTGRVVDAVFAAVRGSGHVPGALAFTRKKPIVLGEPEGVRLALILVATRPINKHERVRALVAGVNAMSTEETYYWFSKCLGNDATRARRALRILLAND